MQPSNNLGWQDHIDAGRRYLKTAQNGLKRPSVFNNALIYQLTAMAVERLLIGIFGYHCKMPADHTLDGLVDELTLFCPLQKELGEQIKALARFDDMCPLVPVKSCIPDDLEIRELLGVGQQVALFSEAQTGTALTAETIKDEK